MAVYNAWTVEYYDGASWTAIDNVQDLSCQVGRQLPTDQWPVSTANIRIWYPTGYASPIPLGIDTKIRFFAPGRSSTEPSWTGWVSNIRVEYGIPYNSVSTEGNADFLVLDCEGEGGRIGRYGTGVRANNDDDIEVYIENGIGTDQDLVIRCDSDGLFTPYDKVDTGSAKYNLWQAVQNVAVYTAGRIIDGVRKKATGWTGTHGVTNDPGTDFKANIFTTSEIATVSFSDSANSATARIYDQFEWDGVADNYFTEASITGTFGATTATYTATAVGAVAPYRQFSAQAYGETAALLQGSAGYWANVAADATISPSSISATTNGQHTQNLDTLGFSNLELAYLATKAVNVTFRGATTLCRIEGVSVTADLNQARFTYYISPAEQTAWFILDDSTFGVLNQNRLGLY